MRASFRSTEGTWYVWLPSDRTGPDRTAAGALSSLVQYLPFMNLRRVIGEFVRAGDNMFCAVGTA
jgi:hypothetical protein